MGKSTKAAASNATALAPIRNDAAVKVPEIVLARNALLDAVKSAEESTKGLYERFANALNALLGKGWPDLHFGGRALTPAEKLLRDRRKAQKEAFFEGAKARNIANPSDAWKNVERWARGETATQQKAGKGARANAPREMLQRQREELSKLYKAGMACEDMSETALEVNGEIGRILRDLLNVDLSTLIK